MEEKNRANLSFTKGQVLINGTDITAASDKELLEMRRREIAMVFQNFGLLGSALNLNYISSKNTKDLKKQNHTLY